MSDWKPEVGQECLLKDEYGCTSTVEITGKGKHGWLVCKVGCSGEGYVPNEKAFFKPVQTEADKQRDEQIIRLSESIAVLNLDPPSLSYRYKDEAKLAYKQGCRIIAPDEYVVKALSDEQKQKIRKRYNAEHWWCINQMFNVIQRELGIGECDE